eukprot:TRINITY_DN3426_c0_g1_i1.p1 TRINITY_DN3426_c0_g1~~TRINITY_DN3426_c0_g1_i1.p1  ORF type:complete len:388 (+),score=110.22 TRINITY_DN3426_c0_g1_i1:111-1166(+)
MEDIAAVERKEFNEDYDRFQELKPMGNFPNFDQSPKNNTPKIGPFPKNVKIVEVGPRDGLQSEPSIIARDTKVSLINKLSNSGLQVIESGAFVSSKWIPQMADSEEVMKEISRRKGVNYPVLTPNIIGYERAKLVGATEVAIFVSASESFSKRNINRSIKKSIERYQIVMEAAKKEEIKVRGYVSVVMGCPYEGKVDPRQVREVAEDLYKMGCYEISLGDTIGVGTPSSVYEVIKEVSKGVPLERIAVHFHDTYSQALSNVLMAFQMGVSVADTSVAGLGGCPYAKGATGNLATEDLVYMLNGMGIETGVDLDNLMETGNWISAKLGRQNRSKVSVAITKKKEDTLPFFEI